MIVNTAGILFFLRAQPKEWYTNGSLVHEVFMLLAFTSVLPPLINSIDIKYRMNGIFRPWGCSPDKITDAKLEEMSEVFQRIVPKKEKTPEEQNELQENKNRVDYWKKKYEPSSMRQP